MQRITWESSPQALGEAFKINTSLQSINLDYNDIGVEGAIYLSAALRINNSLQSIKLDWNGISNVGAKNLSEALATNYTLLELELKHVTYELFGHRLDGRIEQALADCQACEGNLEEISLLRH